jgi:hypothetical protein
VDCSLALLRGTHHESWAHELRKGDGNLTQLGDAFSRYSNASPSSRARSSRGSAFGTATFSAEAILRLEGRPFWIRGAVVRLVWGYLSNRRHALEDS